MDSLVKQWHQHLADHAYKVGSTPIPGEGWLLWIDNAKFSSFSQKKFDQEIQTKHSQAYWMQLDKLGTTFHHIDWQVSGNY